MKCLGVQTPRRMRRFPCSQDFLLTLTCHLPRASVLVHGYTTKTHTKVPKRWIQQNSSTKFHSTLSFYVFCNRILLVQRQSMRIKQQFISRLFKKTGKQTKGCCGCVKRKMNFFGESRLEPQGSSHAKRVVVVVWSFSILCHGFYCGCIFIFHPSFVTVKKTCFHFLFCTWRQGWWELR
jgi:hypothetical protein